MNNQIISRFNNYIENNKISHAYLIEVNNYDSDYKLILNFVKMILTNSFYQDVINCDNDIFKQIDDGNYVDLFVIEPDGNNIKKNQLLKLQEEFSNKSLLDNKRIYIIKECDKLNDASANTMLKFLEEPNDNIIGILLTTNRYKVIDTIISRCQILNISPDQCLNEDNDNDELIQFVLNPKKMISNINYVYENYFIDKKIAKNNLLIIQNILISSFEDNKIFNGYSNIEISKIILIIEEELKILEYNLNIKLWLDSFIVKLMEV